jgi:LPXTG-site transpeptidase (sortase) family protein
VPETTAVPPLPVPKVYSDAEVNSSEAPTDADKFAVIFFDDGGSLQLFEGIQAGHLAIGPSHWEGTAVPGQVGMVTIAGHRISHGAPFRDLDKFGPGRRVILRLNNENFTYEYRETKQLPGNDYGLIDQAQYPGEKMLELFACDPPGSTSMRIAVYFEQVDP